MLAVRSLVLVAALALGACHNIVETDVPILTLADASPEWTVKPGLWLYPSPPEDKCRFDKNRSVHRWPDCAQFMLVEHRPLLAALSANVGDRDWIVVEVDPGLYAVQGATREPEPDFELFFLTREAVDAHGDATRIGLGIQMLCGPWAPDGTTWPDGQGRALTLEPYPGAILGQETCTPDGKSGLFSLVRANRDAGLVAPIEWLRAPRPDEVVYLRRRKAKDQAAEAARKKREDAQSTIAE